MPAVCGTAAACTVHAIAAPASHKTRQRVRQIRAPGDRTNAITIMAGPPCVHPRKQHVARKKTCFLHITGRESFERRCTATNSGTFFYSSIQEQLPLIPVPLFPLATSSRPCLRSIHFQKTKGVQRKPSLLEAFLKICKKRKR